MRKNFSLDTIKTAEKIYDWLEKSGAYDRNIRSRREVLEKTGIREELLKESMEYLKRRGLVSQNRDAYAIIRKKVLGDFPKPTTAELAYAAGVA